MDAKGITEAINRAYPSGTGTYQVNVADRAIAKAQAEISFKAGYEAKESEFEVARIALSEVYGNGHKAGIREVVEWIEKNILMNFGIVSVRTDEWQAKLKEWGIKEG